MNVNILFIIRKS